MRDFSSETFHCSVIHFENLPEWAAVSLIAAFFLDKWLISVPIEVKQRV